MEIIYLKYLEVNLKTKCKDLYAEYYKKKKIPNEWRDIVYAFLERLSVVKTSVFSKLICLLLFSRFVLHAKSLQLCLTL